MGLAGHTGTQAHPRWEGLSIGTGLFMLSAGTLAFEINLTRLYSVTQFYHFAFMIVSLALLGYGASGTALAVIPGLARLPPRRALSLLSLGAAVSMLAAVLLMNRLPFDSFSVAWDRRQVVILTLHYVALAAPFLFAGTSVGLLLTAQPLAAGETYAVNLLGSALGCGIALIAPALVGGEGTVVLSAGLAALGGLAAGWSLRRIAAGSAGSLTMTGNALIVLLTVVSLGLAMSGRRGLAWIELTLSPYKSLSYALQYPGAEIVFSRWNSFSRVDIVRSAGVRSLPGLSYRYLQAVPAQSGLLVDGDDLSPILAAGGDMAFAEFLPAAVAFRLRPRAQALILEPRGGLDVVTALALGAQHVTAVEGNPLIVEAAGWPYTDPAVTWISESGRSYTRRATAQYDVVVLSLSSAYHPVQSGAYSLAEDYRYTVESFEDALARLDPNGVLVVTRWLQDPPSESLRSFAIAVTALEHHDGKPEQQIVAFRGYNTGTLLVKNSPYTADELAAIRAFAGERAFDLTYAPDIRPDEVNRYNVLPAPIYYEAFTALLAAHPRQAFFDAYPFEVSPPTDDRPFFGHFFKWSQAAEVWAGLGKTWQPFGGAGYFVILAVLALATLLAAVLIVLPAIAMRARGTAPATRPTARVAAPFLAYCGFVGLAYLLVEIPLIQQFILFLDHPSYALAAVLFSLLFFSGLGSRVSRGRPLSLSLAALAVLLLTSPWWLPGVLGAALGLPLAARLAIAIFLLAPVGLLMGIPFPAGIARLPAGAAATTLVPWGWAVNGAASVIASVLAALLALSFGFGWVLRLGALCYAAALVMAQAAFRPPPALPPRP